MSDQSPVDPPKPQCGGGGSGEDDYDFPLHLAAVCRSSVHVCVSTFADSHQLLSSSPVQQVGAKPLQEEPLLIHNSRSRISRGGKEGIVGEDTPEDLLCM